MTHLPFRVVPLDAERVAELRETRRAPRYGHPAHEEIATGEGPCRACLAPFVPGVDSRLLFTHDAFAGTGDPPLPGPVFVHAGPCTLHAGAGLPAALRAVRMTVTAYGDDRREARREALDPDAADAQLAALLADPGVRYLHLRHAVAGCYIARVERA